MIRGRTCTPTVNDPVNNADPSGHCYGFPSVVTWEGIEYVANMRGPSGQRRTVTGVGLECSEVPGGWIHYIIAEDAGPYCLERIKHKAMFEATISNPNTNEAALPFPGGLDIGAALGAFGSAVGTALAGGIGASATALGALVSLFPFLLTGSSAQTQSGPVSVALTDAKSLDTIKNHSGFYFGAALIGEEKKWTIVTPPMTRETAISWAQISAASAYISESGMNLYTNTSWGLYCPSHLEAYSLAAMFSGGNFPVGPEVYGKGEFMHYHTAKPSKFMGRYRHFHFWFGFPVF